MIIMISKTSCCRCIYQVRRLRDRDENQDDELFERVKSSVFSGRCKTGSDYDMRLWKANVENEEDEISKFILLTCEITLNGNVVKV